MDCERSREDMLSQLLGELGEAETWALRAHIDTCRSCAQEQATLRETWDHLGQALPATPDREKLDERFSNMVDAYVATESASYTTRTEIRLPRLLRVAATLLLGVLLGIAVGRVGTGGPSHELLAELGLLRQDLLITMLKLDSTSHRLQAIERIRKTEELNVALRQILLETLRHDPSVNVRLAALDALARFVDHPEVINGLRQARDLETAPLIQDSLEEVLRSANDI